MVQLQKMAMTRRTFKLHQGMFLHPLSCISAWDAKRKVRSLISKLVCVIPIFVFCHDSIRCQILQNTSQEIEFNAVKVTYFSKSSTVMPDRQTRSVSEPLPLMRTAQAPGPSLQSDLSLGLSSMSGSTCIVPKIIWTRKFRHDDNLGTHSVENFY